MHLPEAPRKFRLFFLDLAPRAGFIMKKKRKGRRYLTGFCMGYHYEEISAA